MQKHLGVFSIFLREAFDAVPASQDEGSQLLSSH